ncbi:CDP-diacylglycerol--serine O-phosphatidyltransferase, partial [Streptomyces sp. SID7982]|nr:CDP-diacylglycerol--serine O-phosphatidyltransferase [Streptomyces sp. SID7982]
MTVVDPDTKAGWVPEADDENDVDGTEDMP